MRWATPVPPPGARCHHLSTSPSGNCWPACSTICARARRGSVRISGSTSCKLIAEADRAAALVGADAAEQARGVELIGEPGIHQAIEIGPVGLDLDPRRAVPPRRRGSPRVRARPSRLRPPPRRRAPSRGRAPGRRRWRSSLLRPARVRSRRRRRRRAGRRRAATRRRGPVSTSAGVWMSRSGPPKKRARTVSVVGSTRLVAAKAVPRWKSLRGFSNNSDRADRLRLQLAEAFVGAFVERDVEERRDAQAADGDGRDCAA